MPTSENISALRPPQNDFAFDGILTLAGDFFMEQGRVHETMRRLSQRLESERIEYAIIGGMALAAHGYARLTLDVDVLMTVEGLRTFRERLVGRGYVPAFPGAQKAFRDAESQIRIEIITAGEFPGDGLPKPVAFPDPTGKTLTQGGVRVITLDHLIELKLASGLSAPHRLRDLADVQDLIMALALPLVLEEELDQSVRAEYRRLWEIAQKASERSEQSESSK